MSNLSELLPTGGGQNSVEFVASGTVASGKPVVLRSDGKVEAVAAVSQSASVGSATQVTSIITQWPSLVYDTSSGTVVYTYVGASDYPTAVVGTISGTSISFGTPVVIYSSAVENLNTAYDATNGKIIVAFRVGANSYGYACVGTVSGTSISFGSVSNFSTAATSASGYGLAYDTANSKFVVTYSDSGNSDRGTAKVGTVSGTAISYGSATVYETGGSSWPDLTYDSANGKVVAVITDNSTTNIKAYVGTVSGTSITFGSGVIVNSGQTGEFNAIGYDVQSGKVIVAYEDRGNSYYGTAKVGTVSGTSISFGAAVVFRAANTGNAYFLVGYDAGVGRTNIFFRIYSPSNQGLVATGTVSGTSITFDSNFTVSNDNRYVGAAYDSVNKKWGYYIRPGANDLDGVVFTTAGTSTNLTATNFIGITAGAISNAATGDVNVFGGINEAQSGLTIASDYYVQADGSLAAGVTSIPYDISGATYASQSLNALSVVGGNVADVALKPDGLKMFLCAGTGVIYEYALSTAFDVSSASYSSTSGNISAQTPALTGISFSPNGAKMYAVGTTNRTIYEFDLSTPWSVVSGSLSYSGNSFSIASKETAPTGVTLNPSGTKVYIIGYNSDSVHEFALSTAFDISSASFTSTFSVSSQDTEPQALQFNSDGTLMFISGSNSSKIYAYNLSSAYDISSSVYNSKFLSLASQTTSPVGFAFNPLGTKLTVFSANNSYVYGYATTQTAFVATVKAGQAISATTINMKDLT